MLCRCGCGCGHSCELKYGPYGKAHNAQGRAALQGEAGEQLRDMRESNAKVRRGHLAKIHGQKYNLDIQKIKRDKTSKLMRRTCRQWF
nr:MAG: hypothetical protein OI716_00850 [Candidatus Methanoperedens sp.]WAI00097.1 MAG: hypothetical protein OI720_00695 [Candidatus Methanoperedens sp.]